jgi:hypothetical protein
MKKVFEWLKVQDERFGYKKSPAKRGSVAAPDDY